MSSISRFLFGFSSAIFLLYTTATSTLAAGERLEVHIHKNSLSGDEWVTTVSPIKVRIEESATGTGIGILQSHNIGLNRDLGPLEFTAKETCTFTVPDENNIPQAKTETISRYDQRPAGEFVIPPLRIPEEEILIAPPAVCSGGEDEYHQFQDDEIKLNPFRTYREYISLPLTSDMIGQELTVSITDSSGENIVSAGPDPIQGYACVVHNSDGSTRNGVCEKTVLLDPIRAQDGVFEIHLVVLDNETQPVVRPTIEEPLVQGVNAEFSGAVTFVGNFLIRTTSLLDWTLAIDETGFRNEKITTVYKKSLNIVNGFFILAFLVIALLWNFSVLISKERLKKMVILFLIGIIGVNFALPLTRLLVDGTNILQRTLLVKDAESPSQNAVNVVDGQIVDPDRAAEKEVLRSDLQTSRISAGDILSAYDLDFGGFVGLRQSAYVAKSYPQELGTAVDTTKLSQKSDLYIDRFEERTWFNLALIGLGAIGQLLIALILLFRYVILWFLLIFSPFIFVLGLFHASRFLFRYWVWLYGRWLLIGPILAMTLFIIVNIWSLAGVPLESTYAAPGSLTFPNTTNLYVSAPGVTSGYLSTPREIMKYIAALMMLYMAGILPFWLTRYIRGGISSASTKFVPFRKNLVSFMESHSEIKTGTSVEEGHNGNGVEETLGKFDTTRVPAVSLKKDAAHATAGSSLGESLGGKRSAVSSEKKPAALQKAATKELVNTLNILKASQPLNEESTVKKARTSEQKAQLLQELRVRAGQGDELAEQTLEKEQNVATKSTTSPSKVSGRNASPETQQGSKTPIGKETSVTESSDRSNTEAAQEFSLKGTAAIPEMMDLSREKAEVPETALQGKLSSAPSSAVGTERTKEESEETVHEKITKARVVTSPDLDVTTNEATVRQESPKKSSSETSPENDANIAPQTKSTHQAKKAPTQGKEEKGVRNLSPFESKIPNEREFSPDEAMRKKDKEEGIENVSKKPSEDE